MLHTLINLHEQRYRWAFEAKKDFLNRFQKLDVRSVDAQKEELTISVYGPTQVGKTTLILTLLGIKEEALSMVSEFLRGTREIGESATVAVTEYIQSIDGYYHVKFPNNEVISNINEQDLELAMFKLRQEIENGEEYSIEPVIIAIPKHLFEEREISIQIVDLPGVESAEDYEVEHVKQCIKHWMPLTDLCLLVNDAADIKALAQYTLRDLRRWYDNPKNYRAILTRATTLESVMKDIQQNKICHATDLIDYYAKLLAKELKVDVNFTDVVYPVEIGNSLHRISGLDDPFYQQIKSIVQDIIEKLTNDLASINFNELSFSSLTKLYREAELESKIAVTESELRIQVFQERLDNIKFIKATFPEVADVTSDEKERIQGLNQLKATIQKEMNRITEMDIAAEVRGQIPSDLSNRYASVINNAAVNFQYKTEELLNKNMKDLNKQLKILGVAVTEQFNLGDTPYIYMISKWINKLWLEDKYFRELFKVRESCENWLKRVQASYEKYLASSLLIIDQLLLEAKNKKNQIKSLHEYEIKKINRELEEAEEQLSDLKEAHKRLQDTWQADCSHARQLQQFFIKHWLLYKEQLEEKCLYGSPEEKWLALQYLQLLVKDGQFIINSIDTVEE
ncbi:hypothetical protein [Peribacillus frigoritolerans]|uniref:hypothetical protein n=1 Tax=Peribacillus frigoritolerans TaxID=450367 RepID=UPI00341A432C